MSLLVDWEDLPSSTFACGPGQSHPAWRNTPLAHTFFERSHRAGDLTTHGLYKNATHELRRLLELPDDYTLFFFPGGATPAMDAVVWSLANETVSGISFGAFSQRWCKEITSRVPGLKADITTCQPGQWVPDQFVNTKTSLVLLTPNETSSGVQLPDDYLRRVWQERGSDTLVAWDATSCAGGRKLPGGVWDVLLFGLQKCFGAGGGTCAVALSPRACERLQTPFRTIPYSLDLRPAVEKARIFQTVNTPSTVNIWLCYQAARWMNEHGGMSAMDALCRTHANYVAAWAEQQDFITTMVPDETYRSYTTLTLRLTDPRIQDSAINKALAATGQANLLDGLKKFSSVKTNSLRVACFPFVDVNGIGEYQKLTALIEKIVRQLRA